MDDFDQIINHAKRIVNTSTTIAGAVFPNGATLRCRCGHSRTATASECARYLSTGWPEHHGQTMAAVSIATSSAVEGPSDAKNALAGPSEREEKA